MCLSPALPAPTVASLCREETGQDVFPGPCRPSSGRRSPCGAWVQRGVECVQHEHFKGGVIWDLLSISQDLLIVLVLYLQNRKI